MPVLSRIGPAIRSGVHNGAERQRECSTSEQEGMFQGHCCYRMQADCQGIASLLPGQERWHPLDLALTRENGVKMACRVCDDGRWVCEDHVDKPWGGASDGKDACHRGSAGMPCPICNRSDREHEPKMPEGYRKTFGMDGSIN